MNIAIQAADLDGSRIDGTRVYLMQMLRRFGALDTSDAWHMYHRSVFNTELKPPDYSNYTVHTVPFPWYWTQTRFAWEMWKLRPEKLWMPVQALPFFLPKNIQTTVTIHDLAFKYFPQHFPARDVHRLNWFTDYAVKKADKLIAVSESTKRDILKFYPSVAESKVRVIYHGFDAKLFVRKSLTLQETGNILKRYDLEEKRFLLYVGAIQPRKNIRVLLDAFAIVRLHHPDVKLVLAGERAWLWEETVRAIENHPFREDIIMPGKVCFSDLAVLFSHAKAFVFPSLYEGFGIPVLEAMASGVPVLCADNSSLPEVGGDAVLYFEATDVSVLAQHIDTVLANEAMRESMIQKGFNTIQRFSWDTCAKETMDRIIS